MLLKAAAITVVALIVSSAGAQQTAAEMQSYDVELVVFRTLSTNATPEERTIDPGASQPLVLSDDEATAGAAVQSAPAATATEVFPPLAPAKFQLAAIADTLRRSRNYQPLAHFGWTQPGFPRTEAHYMSIDPQAAAGTGLSGRVAVSRGRYLHLTLDLVYEPPNEPGQRYVLRTTRRMRSNERHYIDHPKFGVVAVIMQSVR